MERRNRDSSAKSIFSTKEQEAVIKMNEKFIDMMKTTTNVKDWNLMREKVTADFIGSNEELVMLFGYIDGVLFAETFKKA